MNVGELNAEHVPFLELAQKVGLAKEKRGCSGAGAVQGWTVALRTTSLSSPQVLAQYNDGKAVDCQSSLRARRDSLAESVKRQP